MHYAIAFDIETAQELSEGWKERGERLGITCVGYCAGMSPYAHYALDERGEYASRMSREQANEVLAYLEEKYVNGYVLVTWNGLFDFYVLYKETGEWERCRRLALNHVDMMFHFFCLKGHYLSLNKALSGCGLRLKKEGVSGKIAPQLWREGKQDLVLDYVEKDALVTYELYRYVESNRRLRWLDLHGQLREVEIERWLKVREALQLPYPDVAWMKNPPSRNDLVGWLFR